MTFPNFDYEKYSKSWSKLQEPIQDFVRLNTEALKGFQAMRPEEFGKVTRPDELWEKQVEWSLANGERAIDYMQKSLQIMQKAMHSFAKELRPENAKKQ